jgi:hypothetical protein
VPDLQPPNVDYTAILKSLSNLPPHLALTAPPRAPPSPTTSSESTTGYRSDGVVDFKSEVLRYEAKCGIETRKLASSRSATRSKGSSAGESKERSASKAHMRSSDDGEASAAVLARALMGHSGSVEDSCMVGTGRSFTRKRSHNGPFPNGADGAHAASAYYRPRGRHQPAGCYCESAR